MNFFLQNPGKINTLAVGRIRVAAELVGHFEVIAPGSFLHQRFKVIALTRLQSDPSATQNEVEVRP